MQFLNEIEFISIDKIFPHETPSIEKLNNLLEKIKIDKYINHPIVATKIREKIIILDGTHRFYALKSLNVNFVPVQLVNYDKRRIRLSSWAWDFKIGEEFMDFIRSFDGKLYFKKGNIGIYEIMIKSRDIFVLNLEKRDNFIKFLNSLVKRISHYNRVLKQDLKEGIIFPRLHHKLFLYLARNNLTIPSGITRFKVQHRILYLKVPLDALNDINLILKFKSDMLNRSYRIYDESVLIFEE
ncbi:MAG: ParB N-terminal domain-containing protein [candidate division WOR-3 bacterium]|nr:ParB N-terminal domain-containing protein [candidate division WOR-3 bacterium]MCX7948220.1 ParB N-terminal domain-containing protein [candidate division WOR-3 bacterium]MDW8150022.1 ParB N-terminal domain-containing protein [candidate division WOR-3 bacterium]